MFKCQRIHLKMENNITEESEVIKAINHLHKCIKEERQSKEQERLNTLQMLYECFVRAHPELKNNAYLNIPLLKIVVASYFDDIYKFKGYTQSIRADAHKQAAYQIEWIARIRPIQILPNAPISEFNLQVNAHFAVFVGFSFLFENGGVDALDKMDNKYYRHLVYSAQYRQISGKMLAYGLCALQELCQNLAKSDT